MGRNLKARAKAPQGTCYIMEVLYLIKPGELTLKSGNRREFEDRLRANIKRQLEGTKCQVLHKGGRFYVAGDADPSLIEDVLGRTPGLAGFARATAVERSVEALLPAAVEAARAVIAAGRGLKFKVETRREYKEFPLDSYAVSYAVGDELLRALPELTVDVHNPDWVLNVEVRDRIYLYALNIPGQRGLPTHSSGKGLLLLSGGIDSPVAGYMMAKRGLKLEALYFHAYPYTSDEAKQKVVDLARIVGRYCLGMKLHVVPFTEVQVRIKAKAREDERTLLMRACMMRIADMMAQRAGCQALVTGESLGQVASQTPQIIRFTGSSVGLPVFRPLIAIEKDQIIGIAKRIGTYEISIRPYDDCCTVFAPSRPLIKPIHDGIVRAFAALDMGPLMEQAARDAVWTDLAG
jgi:tRNA uracil 4-sulfurtransferase